MTSLHNLPGFTASLGFTQKQLLQIAVGLALKWLSVMHVMLQEAVSEKVRPHGPLLSTQETQRATAGPLCHLET